MPRHRNLPLVHFTARVARILFNTIRTISILAISYDYGCRVHVIVPECYVLLGDVAGFPQCRYDSLQSLLAWIYELHTIRDYTRLLVLRSDWAHHYDAVLLYSGSESGKPCVVSFDAAVWVQLP